MGSGLVSVVSRAEELRRRARAFVFGSKEQSLEDRLKDLTGELLNATVEQLTGATIVFPHAIPPTPEVRANTRSRVGLHTGHGAARKKIMDKRERVRFTSSLST